MKTSLRYFFLNLYACLLFIVLYIHYTYSYIQKEPNFFVKAEKNILVTITDFFEKNESVVDHKYFNAIIYKFKAYHFVDIY